MVRPMYAASARRLRGRPVKRALRRIGVSCSTVWIGPDGRVRRHWARVSDAAKHPKQVIEALQGA